MKNKLLPASSDWTNYSPRPGLDLGEGALGLLEEHEPHLQVGQGREPSPRPRPLVMSDRGRRGGGLVVNLRRRRLTGGINPPPTPPMHHVALHPAALSFAPDPSLGNLPLSLWALHCP